MGCYVRGGKNGMGCFVRGDKNCMGCFVAGPNGLNEGWMDMSKTIVNPQYQSWTGGGPNTSLGLVGD